MLVLAAATAVFVGNATPDCLAVSSVKSPSPRLAPVRAFASVFVELPSLFPFAVFIVGYVVAGELVFLVVIDTGGFAVPVVFHPFARLFAPVESAFAPLAAIGVVQHPRAVFFAVFVLDVFEMTGRDFLRINVFTGWPSAPPN